MRKISFFLLACSLVLSLLLVGCDESDEPNDIIDNKIEADDFFGGDFGTESESVELNEVETMVESDSDPEVGTAE